ncbi:hypothetical protein OsJ_26584 [Oryza sativa Japonica Group]|uniref:Uncharacterized protein n=1 Tax=Oryza sativa subsp. japonica TaxID=39947 RepID=B9FZU6_ORYSJ|nr:hypothetical protein OsJ_26584 [Oryza sativa Japonica Group]
MASSSSPPTASWSRRCRPATAQVKRIAEDPDDRSLDKSAKVVIGGGQDAMNVTMTNCLAGKFEPKFFHKILQEEIGVKGHFGPINVLAFNPDGWR